MKLLITGINGFVAQHFLQFLSENDPGFTILGIGKSPNPFLIKKYPNLNLTYLSSDLLHKNEVGNIIKNFRPDYLLHLASISSVKHSWEQPQESFVNNTNIFLNIVEEIRLQKSPCRILSVGSSEEYGIISPEDLPINESHRLNPANPYAVARVSQEMISKIYYEGYGMNIIMTRSFNHIGPGQKETFVVSSFAKQLAAISKNNNLEKSINVGNLSIVRDFLDVRDVVKAYYLLLKKGIPGEIYNVSSGTGFSLKEIIEKMCGMLNITVNIKENKELFRPIDNQIIIGDCTKIKNELSWSLSYSIEESLRDLLLWWQQHS